MVQFGFLSAHRSFDLCMHFKQVIQTDTIKWKAWQKSLFLTKQVGGRRHFGFLQSASRFVCPSIDGAEKLQNLRQIQNLDTQAAEKNAILLTWHTLKRTNVIEVNYRAKIANKTANITYRPCLGLLVTKIQYTIAYKTPETATHRALKQKYQTTVGNTVWTYSNRSLVDYVTHVRSSNRAWRISYIHPVTWDTH